MLETDKANLAKTLRRISVKHPPAGEHVLGYFAWLCLFLEPVELQLYSDISKEMPIEELVSWLESILTPKNGRWKSLDFIVS